MSPSTDTRESREFARGIKFLVTPAVAERIGDWARGRLAPDPNAGSAGVDTYRISSLYFDTEHFDVFHRRGSFGRSKYRIRRYGESDLVFLERKLKTHGLLSKRRSILEMERIHLLGNGGAGRGWAGCWFQRRLEARRLRPVCQISYQRTARVALTDYGPIRLTLDQGIEAVPAVGMAFSERSCGANFLNDHIILELKFRCDLPSMFKLLIEEFALGPQPVSKYRMASVALGLATPGAELSVEKPASIGDLSGGGGQSAGSDTASGNGNFTTTALAI